MKKLNFWQKYIIYMSITCIMIAILYFTATFIIKNTNKNNVEYVVNTRSVIYIAREEEPIYLQAKETEETEYEDVYEEVEEQVENTENVEEQVENTETIEEPAENVEPEYTNTPEPESSQTNNYYISGVPYINQYNLGYPMGCEAVSATMAAKYAGYNVSVEDIIANTPTDLLGKRQEIRTITDTFVNENGETETISREELVWIGENPFKYFVGSPTKTGEQGAYGCFAEPIATSLTSLGISSTNISGCGIDTVYDYIRNGKPVIIWCRARARDLNEGVVWQYPDGSGEYTELIGEHCSVLIGYDENYIYLNDPAIGKGVSQPRAKFEENWYKLFSQAVIID